MRTERLLDLPACLAATHPHALFNPMTMIQKVRLFGAIEATSFVLLLFVAMPLKYFADLHIAVSIVGSIHGFLVLLYWTYIIMGVFASPMPVWLGIAGFFIALVPFGPLFIDGTLKRYDRPTETAIEDES